MAGKIVIKNGFDPTSALTKGELGYDYSADGGLFIGSDSGNIPVAPRNKRGHFVIANSSSGWTEDTVFGVSCYSKTFTSDTTDCEDLAMLTSTTDIFLEPTELTSQSSALEIVKAKYDFNNTILQAVTSSKSITIWATKKSFSMDLTFTILN